MPKDKPGVVPVEIVAVRPDAKVAEELPEERPLEVGQWYWVRDGRKPRWLGCVVRIGTNYAKMEGVHHTARIHFDEFHRECEFEPDPDSHIDAQVRKHQDEVGRLMGKVRELTARLGVAPSPELTQGGETRALAKVEAGRDFKKYSKDLVKAKDKTLPELFRRIRDENEAMASWMKAKVIPLRAQAEGMKSVVGRIEDRIFSVELYAGLTEELELVADGDPAPLDAKVHLLQRRHYMDEECLARYEAGGMDYRSVSDFDAWLCRPDNLDRLLPFPRCVAAFQVRRRDKEREAVDLSGLLRILEEERADRQTFLYVRNGGKVYRMSTALDFGEKLFPDMERSKLSGHKLWAKEAYPSWTIITDDERQGMIEDHERECREFREREAAYEAALRTPEAMERARKKGVEEPDASCVDVPWPGHDPSHFSRLDEWVPYTPDSVYYDDVTAKIQEDIKHHNRIALVLQGLLDRSPAFHPHPPWQIWTDEGFRSALELVYDEDRALPAGERPDFEAYRARLNASLTDGSVTVGQEDAWELDEGAKETRRLQNDWRYKGGWFPKRHRPAGNPGPGKLARVFRFVPKAGTCTYAWDRERQTRGPNGDYGDPIRTTFTCDSSRVLNVDAYRPGDFRIFFDDPRTRADYLKWAPLLLEAEEYHAGNRKASDPVEPRPARGSSWEGRRRYRMRKLRKQLIGKAVRLKERITTVGGKAYEPGTLWRVTGGEGRKFSISGILEDGSYEEGERWVRDVLSDDFEVDPSIPDPPEEDGND